MAQTVLLPRPSPEKLVPLRGPSRLVGPIMEGMRGGDKVGRQLTKQGVRVSIASAVLLALPLLTPCP